MDCDKVTELLPGYVVSSLSDDECAEVTKHLRHACQQCEQELCALLEAASTLAEGLAPVEPRPEVKQALLQRIASESQSDVDHDNLFAVAASPFSMPANLPVEAPNSSDVALDFDATSLKNDAVAPDFSAVAPNILAVVNGPLAFTPDPSTDPRTAPRSAAPNRSARVPGRAGKPVATRLLSRRAYLPYVAASLCAMAAGSLLANLAQVSPPGFRAGDALPGQAITPQWRVSIEAAEQAFGPPRAQLTKFGGSVAEQGFQAAIFYDGLAKQWHIVVFETSPPAENQQLWLWFLDFQGNIVSGGQLKYLGQQRAAGVFELADMPQQLMEAVITSEPMGEHSRPTSPPLGRAHLKYSS